MVVAPVSGDAPLWTNLGVQESYAGLFFDAATPFPPTCAHDALKPAGWEIGQGC